MNKLVLVLAGFVLMASCKNEKKIKEEHSIKVQVANIGGSTAGQGYLSASGKIEAENSSNISTRMMGTITQIHVKVGQRVGAGQTLVSVNSTDLYAKKAQVEAGIIQARAAFNSAKKDYDRFQSLYKMQSASQKELDDMSTRYEMAKAGLDAANAMKREIESQFSYLNIRAPFSGVVTNTFAKEGDMANPGMPLVSIEGTGNLQVTAMVPENVITAVKQGMPVKVDIKSANKVVNGTVSEVSMSAKNTGGQYLVKIKLPNAADKEILSGMFVQVQFPISAKNQNEMQESSSVWIPESALVHQGQLVGVYALGENKTAILRWVRIGKKNSGQVEILSGLSQGETYITSSEESLFNGAKVNY
jgi:RND family efflux transporter MFP subunit